MFKKPPYGTKFLRRVLTAPTALRRLTRKWFCAKNRGVVSPYFACRKFRYDPLLRAAPAGTAAL